MLGPKTWHREHCSMNLISPCLISAALAVFSGGLGKGSSLRAGGFGTSPPPSLKAIMRLTFWYLAAALLEWDRVARDVRATIPDLDGHILFAIDRIGHWCRHDVAAGLDRFQHLAGVSSVHPELPAASTLKH